MGLITTGGKYCYVQCDRRNCNRKMEHVDLNLLKDLAKLCGWENSGSRWTCPGCAEQTNSRKGPEARQKRLRTELEA